MDRARLVVITVQTGCDDQQTTYMKTHEDGG
jgi:hypothetical protein